MVAVTSKPKCSHVHLLSSLGSAVGSSSVQPLSQCAEGSTVRSDTGATQGWSSLH